MDLLIGTPEVRRAVLVGIGKGYGDVTANLDGPPPDVVRHVRPMLLGRGRYDDRNLTVLLDGDGDKRNVVEAVSEMYAKTRRDDVALWMQSSHGSRWPSDVEEDGYDELLCMAGCLGGGDFKSLCIVDDEVRLLADAAPRGARLAWWMDLCHSGDITREMLLMNGPMVKPRYLPPPDVESPHERFLPMRRIGQVTTPTRNEFAFSACRADQTAADTVEGGGPCGAFTFHMVAALNAASDASLLSALHASCVRRVRKARYSQDPQYGVGAEDRGRAVDFIF